MSRSWLTTKDAKDLLFGRLGRKLRNTELADDELVTVVGTMVDRVLRTEGPENLESNMLHALLLLPRRDPALQRRVVKYLRCESLNTHDRKLLGGLAARDQPEDSLRTIEHLAHIQFELQTAALVIVQIEETIPDGQTVTRFQQAFDSLRASADAVPSAVVVISCLDDVYTIVRPKLSKSLVDRLESDPGVLRLTSQRQIDEVELILEHLYSELDVPWREDDPIYPFTAAQIEAVSKFRARDCLAKFREFHAACIAAGEIVVRSGAVAHKCLDLAAGGALVPQPRAGEMSRHVHRRHGQRQDHRGLERDRAAPGARRLGAAARSQR